MDGNQVGAVYYDARIDTGNLRRDGKQVEDTVNRIAKNGDRSFRDFSRSASREFNSIATGIGRLAKVAAALFIGGALGAKTFIDSASELQSMRASFESMTGSAKKASSVLGQLNKFSFETAFSTEEINKAAQLLLGAGLEVKKLGRYMKAIGDVAGATGADLGQLTLPLSQSLARGKLQTQDFYQILNSGAGKLGQVLREELAKRGMGDFQEAMEKGEVTAEILFDVIEKSAKKGGFAFKGAIKQSETFNGRMSNLMETINGVALEVLGVDKATGEIDPQGVFAKLSQAVQDATDWLRDNKREIREVANIIIANAVPAISGIAGAFIAAKAAAILFGIAAMTTDEIVRKTVIGAVIALIGALVYLQVKFNIFGEAWKFIQSVWNGAVGYFTGVVNGIVSTLVKVFEPMVRPFIRAYNTIKATFAQVTNAIIGPFKTAFEWVQRRWNELMRAIGATDVKGRITPTANKVGGKVLSNIPGVNFFHQLSKRASGGPVSAGMPYLVGENADGSINRTTELFVPNSSGQIYSSDQLRALLSASSSKVMSPTIPDDYTSHSASGGRTWNIQNITIAKEVDGERWIRRLTGDQEIVAAGLVPTQGYGGSHA